MTIQQSNHAQFETAKVKVIVLAKRLRPLSPHNLWDYLRLLVWILFQPQYIKAYRIRCDIPRRQMLQKQASTLSMFFIWLPLLPWLIVPWIMDHFPIHNLVMTVMLLSVVAALIISIRFGITAQAKTANGLMAGLVLVPFSLTAVIAYTLQETAVTSLWVIGFTVFAIICSLLGMVIASIFKLHLAEKLGLANSIILGGGLATTIFSLHEAALLPISAIIISAFLVGVIEDRYEMNVNQQG